MWNNENGPNGGDEINIILAGRNYGWPVGTSGATTQGRGLGGIRRDGFENHRVRTSAIAVAGMASTPAIGSRRGKGNVFVGAMRRARFPAPGHLERIVFNARTEEMRREIHADRTAPADPRRPQDPDGLLCLLTDEDQGALLKMEPAPLVRNPSNPRRF